MISQRSSWFCARLCFSAVVNSLLYCFFTSMFLCYVVAHLVVCFNKIVRDQRRYTAVKSSTIYHTRQIKGLVWTPTHRPPNQRQTPAAGVPRSSTSPAGARGTRNSRRPYGTVASPAARAAAPGAAGRTTRAAPAGPARRMEAATDTGRSCCCLATTRWS